MDTTSVLTNGYNYGPSYCDGCFKSLSTSANLSTTGNTFTKSHIFDDISRYYIESQVHKLISYQWLEKFFIRCRYQNNKLIILYFLFYSSLVEDDITYRALPDLHEMLSQPNPYRVLRSVTPPPNLTSLTAYGGMKTLILKVLYISNMLKLTPRYHVESNSIFSFFFFYGIFENVFTLASTLTSNRYPYNSTMSELIEDLTSQRNRSSKNFFAEENFDNSRWAI